MSLDPATALFLEDAKRLGLSQRQYEKKFRIHLMSAERRIAEHEITVDHLPVEAFGLSYDDPDTDFDPLDTVAAHLHSTMCDTPWYDCEDEHVAGVVAEADTLLRKLRKETLEI